jgi:hypothetical protein
VLRLYDADFGAESAAGGGARITEWDRVQSDEGHPIRGIVKELILEQPPFEPIMILGMMRNLRGLNAFGIQRWDVKNDMYVGSGIGDLSQGAHDATFAAGLKQGIVGEKGTWNDSLIHYDNFGTEIVNAWNHEHLARFDSERFLPSKWVC